jgi:uncharacterized protein YoxC
MIIVEVAMAVLAVATIIILTLIAPAISIDRTKKEMKMTIICYQNPVSS